MRIGWVKNWRKKWDNPFLRGNPYRIAAWDWILSHAEWNVDVEKRQQHVIEGKRRPLNLGEICCGRDQIARDTGVSASGVQKILSGLVSEHMLEQQTYSRFRLLKVKNWEQYQGSEHITEHIRDSEVTSGEHQSNTTNKEYNKKISKKSYVARPETEALYSSIEEMCEKYGLKCSVNLKSLDVLVERYVGKIKMKVEAQHCISWLVGKNFRDVTTQRIGNWFKKAQEIQKRDQLKQLESKNNQE